jgi:hypothetical protein
MATGWFLKIFFQPSLRCIPPKLFRQCGMYEYFIINLLYMVIMITRSHFQSIVTKSVCDSVIAGAF